MSAVETTPRSGYSTQAQISLEVASMINNGRIRFWFAAAFSPIENSPRANPLKIFEELDRAPKDATYESEKALLVAAKLQNWVNDFVRKGRIYHQDRAKALYAIKMARRNKGFLPKVFHLSNVVGSGRGNEVDEYVVENHPIAGSNSRQILPPLDR